jgi:hypothetical protein
MVSLSNNGAPGNKPSQDAYLSADGRFVVFTSFADNLVSDSPADCPDKKYCSQKLSEKSG